MKKLLLIFMIFYICMPINVHSQTDSYLEYTTEGNTAVITGLKPDARARGLTALEIPSVIDGFTVVGLGEEAFSYKYFDSITIPDTVESIGYMCFFGTGVKEGQKIHIPKSVKEIGTYAFSYMKGVEAFLVDPKNPYNTSLDGVLFSKDRKKLLNYPLSKKDVVYFLPVETELLYCTCFGNCTNLKKLVIQNNIVTRMGYTFFGCDMTLYGDRDCYTRLWMDELTDQFKYGKVKYGGTEVYNDFSQDDESDNKITVVINGRKMVFDQEPVIFNNRLLVPLRAIFEELGASVTWNNSTKTAIATKDDLKIVLQIDNDEMLVNDKVYILDAPAQSINSRTFVPLRAVSEALGAEVNWDNNTKTIYIDTSEELSLSLSNGKTVVIGWDIDELIDEMGLPNRKEISIYGLEWYVYNGDYRNFVMVAVDSGKVCGFYTNSKGFSLSNGLYYGCPYDINLERQGGAYIIAYVDIYNENTYHAVLVTSADYSLNTVTRSKEFIHIQSLENFDATNAFRANYGLEPLIWDEYAADAAQRHSQDMADNDYFSHTSLDGRSGIDRYLDIKKVSWRQWGENISAGRMYGVDSFDGWVNSEGHRRNILNKNYKYLGIGGGYNSNSYYNSYMTQFFITY